MNNPLEARNFRLIEDEGDGYRSYVGICLSLLVVKRPVATIDEPELCLHPPQAYHIGKFIGNYAADEHVTFVATHSSQVLRGILETGRKVTVLRLTRRGGKFSAKVVDSAVLENAVKNPRTRSEAILDGIFSKGAVLVESEGDREEYLAAAEGIEDHPSREVHFVPVGGVGGFSEPLRFYQTLGIPSAVIADLDALCDVDKTCSIVRLLCQEDDMASQLCETVRKISQQIKALPPNTSSVDVQVELSALSKCPMDWSSGDDNVIRQRLKKLADRLKRVTSLKEGGIAAYANQPAVHSALEAAVAQLAKVGLFLVPVGELEDWVAELMNDVPKHSVSKTDRAAIAAGRIRSVPHKVGDIWAFVEQVMDFVQSRSAGLPEAAQ
jgi:hypothetical protein